VSFRADDAATDRDGEFQALILVNTSLEGREKIHRKTLVKPETMDDIGMYQPKLAVLT